uniref:Uncharacterized protein n=1 Tax=Utricularia reniformis TaxID=192314 RepID=A0A1Y0B1H6_9LAMI|nr:hypothetical protein AEK19_MT1025 [Utricularia reniformis]ART31247.1 hypothetical protein AEK19_MT1025 [Utricularia reniformis]
MFVYASPLNIGMTWSPSWKALPNYGSKGGRMMIEGDNPLPKSPYFFFLPEWRVFATLINIIHSRGEQESPLALWPRTTLFALDSSNSKWARPE